MIEKQGDLEIISGRDIPGFYLKVISVHIKMLLQEMAESGHPFAPLLDISGVDDMIHQQHQEAWLEVFCNQIQCKHGSSVRNIVGAIGYSFAPLWWAKKDSQALVESFVIGIDPSYKGFGRAVLKRVDYLAKIANSQLIMTGNLMGLNPQLTANLYEKKGGYDFKYSHFFKMPGR